MNNVTKMKIAKPAHDAYEAFVDPEKIGNFWFSSSSERWEPGKTITLRYEEYNAEGTIHVVAVEEDKKIEFTWGSAEDPHTVTITLHELDSSNTIVEVNEDGFHESDENFIHDLIGNKEGWVYMLTCLKGYLENGINNLRAGLWK
ncbi:SRPBCC family protein [Brevibacillus choshinensis]|uniref:SRPBCC family protein n=1 Tax=Brevibacillus choshinensis TaxID=54911 RepID=UPI002E1AD499|nr:SRPBCC family protein [Brevibacillus choshinensis]